ncbi:MAG: cysteine hydrolase [Defluviitaleaceae bacterium]|nr:cysteine hydrolase [Defluviitaleaceae bacterium]
MYDVLIVVDMQKDFIDGTLGTNEALAVVANAAARISCGRGELVLFTQDTHGDDYLDTPEGKKLPVTHCIKGTVGWEIDSAVRDAWHNNPDTIIVPDVPKNTFTKSVFGSTALVEFLVARQNEINTIEILGICTDICVISNAIMIKNTMPHIPISVNANCCAGVTPQSHQQALNVMAMCHIDII